MMDPPTVVVVEESSMALSYGFVKCKLRSAVASLMRLFRNAMAKNADVYIFGRKYTSGGLGIHDVHMNQGSTGSFVNNGVDDHNDHNDVWQDGAVLVDLGDPEWVGYFTAFTQQLVPTDDLGNPKQGGHSIG
jgi:uncharacterized protein YukJ